MAELDSAFARFRDRFLRRFAPLYAELDRLESEIATLIAEREQTEESRNAAEAAEERAAESERAARDEGQEPPMDEDLEPATDELKALFRQTAKVVHPDLATDDEEKARRHERMAALNQAFAARDADAIREILYDEQLHPEMVTGDDTPARLVRIIRRIAQVRRRLADIEAMMLDLRSDPLFDLFEGARDSREPDPLAEDEATLRRRIASARARLEALRGAA